MMILLKFRCKKDIGLTIMSLLQEQFMKRFKFAATGLFLASLMSLSEGQVPGNVNDVIEQQQQYQQDAQQSQQRKTCNKFVK